MGVRGLLFFVLGAVLLYTCIPSVFGSKVGGLDYSGSAGYARYPGSSRRGYGGYSSSGRWWCTCRWWCRYDEWRVRNTCAIPFYQYWMKTCCKWLPWYKTSGYGYGGYGGRYRGYGGPGGNGYSRPGDDYSGYAGYGSYPGGAGGPGGPGGPAGLGGPGGPGRPGGPSGRGFGSSPAGAKGI